MSQSKLAKKATLSQPVIAAIENGKQHRTQKIMALAKALECEPGDIDSDYAGLTEFADHNGEALSQPTDGIREIDVTAGMGDGQTAAIAYKPSDQGWEAVDAFKSESWIFPSRIMRDGFGSSAGAILAVATRGDSMFPTITHGSVVFVDTRDTRIKPQELYALRDAYGDIVVKRLDLVRDGESWRVRIQSDNPAAQAREEPIEDIAIVGRVRGIFKLI